MLTKRIILATMRKCIRVTLVITSLLPTLAFATEQSAGLPIITGTTSMHYKTSVNANDGGCYHKYTNEVLIEAQDGVGSSDDDYTGRCPNGYVVMEGYTFLKVRERHEADAYNVLRAISSKDGILCCPFNYAWGT